MIKKILGLLLTILMLSGCTTKSNGNLAIENSTDKISKTLYAMDTVMDISVFSNKENILNEVESIINDLESRLSTTIDSSEIYTLNKNSNAYISDDTAILLEKALSYCDKTDGALDISIYPVVREWGFTTGEYKVPEDSVINNLLSNVDYSKIKIDKDQSKVSLPAGMKIDLGSVAKGYTGDKIVEFLKSQNVTSGLLNLGGNVQALGSKPNGEQWKIGIQDPLGDGYIGVISVSDKAVITSGGYERYFEDNKGNIYWHIIDPESGYPAKNGVISATAIGPEGAYCDALSTSLFIKGEEDAVEFWRQYKDFSMILVTDSYEVLITPDIEDNFDFNEDGIYKLKVISDVEN